MYSMHKKHPKELVGYEGRLETLAQDIHRMDYNSVRSFYQHAILELQRQSEGDTKRNRLQLAKLLEEATKIVKQLESKFSKIAKLCEPYMEKE